MSVKELCAKYIAQCKKEHEETSNEAFSKSFINASQMYSLKCIDIKDVCWLLKCTEEELPKEFYWYANLYGIQYDTDMKILKLTEDINKQCN